MQMWEQYHCKTWFRQALCIFKLCILMFIVIKEKVQWFPRHWLYKLPGCNGCVSAVIKERELLPSRDVDSILFYSMKRNSSTIFHQPITEVDFFAVWGGGDFCIFHWLTVAESRSAGEELLTVLFWMLSCLAHVLCRVGCILKQSTMYSTGVTLALGQGNWTRGGWMYMGRSLFSKASRVTHTSQTLGLGQNRSSTEHPQIVIVCCH